jgi:hypothetical protein
VNSSALNFYLPNKNKFNLFNEIMNIKAEFALGEWAVKVADPEDGYIHGRLCVVRKSLVAIEQAIKKLKRDASKRQQALKPETLEFAKYIIVFTTLPCENYPTNTVLEWYRLRWQIELIFKRLKSLAGLGHLPKYDDTSAKAWLYGKLFIGLLVEKMILHAKNISPWGHYLL